MRAEFEDYFGGLYTDIESNQPICPVCDTVILSPELGDKVSVPGISR